MVGMDVGVAWAATAPECDFDNGGHIVGDKCVYDKDLPQQGDPNYQSYMCEQEGYVGWDSNAKKCVTGDELCSGLGLKYDPGVKNCIDPDDPATVQQSTLIPYTGFSETECEDLFRYGSANLEILKDVVRGVKVLSPSQFIVEKDSGKTYPENISPLDVLGCGIKTGRISMWMIPFFIKYLIQFAISIAGLVAVGAIIIGGYFYLFGGLVDDKEKGKRAIMYGLGGFVVVLLAWTIVNAVIALLTR